MKILLTLLLVTCCISASAQVYKCAGPDGKMSYQATACASNEKDTAIKLKYVSNSTPESSSAAASSAASASSPSNPAKKTDAEKSKDFQTARKIRDAKDRIETIEFEINKLRSKMDSELAVLRDKRKAAGVNNNSDGRGYCSDKSTGIQAAMCAPDERTRAAKETSVNTEMQTVTASYEIKIKVLQDEATSLRAEIVSLK